MNHEPLPGGRGPGPAHRGDRAAGGAGQVSITELLRRSRDGDREACDQLFSVLGDERALGAVIHRMTRRFLPKRHRVRRLVDTGDIVQSALGSALRNFDTFHGTSEGELFGWLRSILRTKVNRQARRREHEIDHEEIGRAAGDRSLAFGSVVIAAIEKEITAQLHSALKQLSAENRLVVELKLRGATSKDVARILDLEPATVRKRESRAVDRLRELMA